MASNVHSDQETGHEKSLLWLCDEVLNRTLINLTLEERIGIERTSKRIKALIDETLSLQKIFVVRPRGSKPVLKSWSKARLFYETLPWRGESSSLSILSRCSSVKLVNLKRVDVRGTDLANWCPFITHFVTDKVAKAADYVQELIKNKNDVLIESFGCGDVSDEPEPVETRTRTDMSFLSNCPRLNTLKCPLTNCIIPPDVLSKVKVMFIYVNLPWSNVDVINLSSKNVEQLTVTSIYTVPVILLADNFCNLVHLEADIKIQDFKYLVQYRKIQSINARWADLGTDNVATFEQFLSTNGSELKYLRIVDCEGNLINRALMSLSASCPKLICFKIYSGIKLKEIELETIKLLPPLGKINLDVFGFTGSPQDVENVTELLVRCKNSMRKVSLTCFQRLCRDGVLFRKEPIPMDLLSEIIRILKEHKRTGGSNAHHGKSLSRIECDGEKWNPCEVDVFRYKMSFYY